MVLMQEVWSPALNVKGFVELSGGSTSGFLVHNVIEHFDTFLIANYKKKVIIYNTDITENCKYQYKWTKIKKILT